MKEFSPTSANVLKTAAGLSLAGLALTACSLGNDVLSHDQAAERSGIRTSEQSYVQDRTPDPEQAIVNVTFGHNGPVRFRELPVVTGAERNNVVAVYEGDPVTVEVEDTLIDPYDPNGYFIGVMAEQLRANPDLASLIPDSIQDDEMVWANCQTVTAQQANGESPACDYPG